MLDILIKNGRVVDPARNLDDVCDVAITGNKIVEPAAGETQAKQTIDASGCYVFPGLIDFHTHMFYGGTHTSSGYYPDLQLATGVTSAVDAGSSGCSTFRAFYGSVISRSVTRIKAFLSCYPGGVLDGGILENLDPSLFDKQQIAQLIDEFPEIILGIKIRLTQNWDLAHDIKPLETVIALSNEVGGVPVCVHVTNPPCKMTEIVNILRKGDVLCHVFHGKGDTLLSDDGRVAPEFKKARERGVIFDVANGRSNCSHRVSQAAISDGFLPDVISTDMTTPKLFVSTQARSLPFVMSKYLSFGMNLTDVVKAVTYTPAKLMKMEGRIGTLAPGAFADAAIFKLSEHKVLYHDSFAEAHYGKELLIPQAVIVNGMMAFANIDFN